jgi:hypothetical protein
MRIEYPTSVTYRLELSILFAGAYLIPYPLHLRAAMFRASPTNRRKVRELSKQEKLATSITTRRVLI